MRRDERIRKTIQSLLMPVLLVIGMAWGLSGCGDDEEVRVVTVYSPHGKEILGDFEQRFEVEHPDIDFRALYLPSQTILDRINSEDKNPVCDIWWGAPSSMFDKAASDLLLEAYRPTWFESVPEYAKHDNDKWYGTFLSPEVILFNRDRMKKEDAPQDWDELIQPKWRGKIVLRYPMESGTMRSIFSAMIWCGSPDKALVDATAGLNWLRALDANVQKYINSPEQMFQHITRSQEALVSMWTLSDIELQRERYSYPFGYVIPPKTPIIVDGIALIQRRLDPDSQRAKDAILAYEFLTSIESQIHLAKSPYYRIPARTDIDSELMPDWITGTNWSEIAMDVNWGRVADYEKDWMNTWQNEIYKQNKDAS